MPISIDTAQAQQSVTEEEAYAIGVDAYLYFYPLVTMDITRKQLTNAEPGKGLSGPMNSFANALEYPAADMKAVVRPNFDTLYSSGWLDLTKEPVIVSVPDTSGRYYLLPMLDMGRMFSPRRAGAQPVQRLAISLSFRRDGRPI
jgi:hypothetical protein